MSTKTKKAAVASNRFKEDDTLPTVEKTLHHGQIVVPNSEELQFKESLNVEGAVNVIFTGFNHEDPNNSAESYGFHLTKEEGEEFAKRIISKFRQKKEKGLNAPNAICFSFLAPEGNYIPESKILWFRGVEEITTILALKGPDRVDYEPVTKEAAREEYKKQAKAARQLKELTEEPSETKSRRRLSPQEKLQQMLAEAHMASLNNKAANTSLADAPTKVSV